MKYKKTDILAWLTPFDKTGERKERIINNVNDVVKYVVEKYGIGKFDNNMNSFSNVFDLVLAYVKIEIAPIISTNTKDLEDYVSLMQKPHDLPLIVWFKVKTMFSYPTYTNADDKYCEDVISRRKLI